MHGQLGVGDSIGLLTLVVVMLEMALTPPIWFKALLLPATVGGAYIFITKSILTAKLKRGYQHLIVLVFAIILLPVGGSQLFVQWRNEHSELILSYDGKKLDGNMKIKLTKEYDPTRPIQPRMLVDKNNPTVFAITGIGMGKDNGPLVSVEWVCLSFPSKIASPPVSGPGWQQENNEGTLFCYHYSLPARIIPHLAIAVPPFYGGPVPDREMKIIMRAYYDKVAEATFSILPP